MAFLGFDGWRLLAYYCISKYSADSHNSAVSEAEVGNKCLLRKLKYIFKIFFFIPESAEF